jgi:hypothetical protein
VPKTNFTILKRQLIENEKRLLRERNPTADETEIKVMAKCFHHSVQMHYLQYNN